MRTFVVLAFLVTIFVCLALAEDGSQLTEQADALLAVDAGDEHSNESPREARQFGYGGRFGGGYGRHGGYGGYGGYGGGFRNPYGGYGGGFYG